MTLVSDSPSQQVSYSLQAIIYSGRNRFSVFFHKLYLASEQLASLPSSEIMNKCARREKHSQEDTGARELQEQRVRSRPRPFQRSSCMCASTPRVPPVDNSTRFFTYVRDGNAPLRCTRLYRCNPADHREFVTDSFSCHLILYFVDQRDRHPFHNTTTYHPFPCPSAS